MLPEIWTEHGAWARSVERPWNVAGTPCQDPMDTWYTVCKWYGKPVRILIFQRLSPR
jgi:hypothetical protein